MIIHLKHIVFIVKRNSQSCGFSIGWQNMGVWNYNEKLIINKKLINYWHSDTKLLSMLKSRD